MTLAGLLASLLIGLAMGLVGGGGGILTVPVLVYLFGVPATAATGYSLVVVGATAVVGAGVQLARKQVEVKTGLLFAGPSILGVFASRRFVVPAIPEVISFGPASMRRDTLLMLLFAVLMLTVALRMIRPSQPDAAGSPRELNAPKTLAVGLVVGLVSGLVGAGGGFLIVPALVLLGGMPMKLAVGTSLMVIALQSLIGFTGEMATGRPLNLPLVGTVVALALAGMFSGLVLARRVPGEKLRPGFGWFVLAMGIFVLIREIFPKG